MTFSIVARCAAAGHVRRGDRFLIAGGGGALRPCARRRRRRGDAEHHRPVPWARTSSMRWREARRRATRCRRRLQLHAVRRLPTAAGAGRAGARWSCIRARTRSVVAGSALGEHCAAAGNLLAHEDVPAAMVAAFEAAEGHFGARLLAGAARGRVSAAAKRGRCIPRDCWWSARSAWPIVDLRVDWSDARSRSERCGNLWRIYAPQIDDYVRRAARSGACAAASACPECERCRRMKFTFRQLAYFIAAAETGSITLASKRANISQPAISTAISHIERELDVQLFLRHHAQGLSLTPAGRALLARCQAAVEAGRAACIRLPRISATRCAASCRSDGSRRWRPSSCRNWCSAFLKAFPETQIRSVESHQEGLLSSSARGRDRGGDHL